MGVPITILSCPGGCNAPGLTSVPGLSVGYAGGVYGAIDIFGPMVGMSAVSPTPDGYANLYTPAAPVLAKTIPSYDPGEGRPYG